MPSEKDKETFEEIYKELMDLELKYNAKFTGEEGSDTDRRAEFTGFFAAALLKIEIDFLVARGLDNNAIRNLNERSLKDLYPVAKRVYNKIRREIIDERNNTSTE